MNDKCAEYRERASQCRSLAAETDDRQGKAHWRRLAKHWEILAGHDDEPMYEPRAEAAGRNPPHVLLTDES